MSYQVFVDGDGEQYWTGYDDFKSAVENFELECRASRRVSLVWEHFDYEPE